MMRFIRPRLRLPVVIAAVGLAVAAAAVVGPGSSWGFSIALVIITGVAAVGHYIRAGKDTDLAAISGSRADERQQQISQRAWALTGKVAAVAAFLVYLVTFAVKGAGVAWPYWLLVFLAVNTYGWGLTRYGADKPSPDDDSYGPAQPPIPVKPGP